MRWNILLLIRRISVLAMLLMFIASTQPTLADVTLVSFEITCEEVSFHATSDLSMGHDVGTFYILVVTSDTTELYYIYVEETSPFEVNVTVPLVFDTTGEYIILVGWEGGEGFVEEEALLFCEARDDGGGGSEAPVSDGRICFGPGEVAAAVYRNNNRLDIYSIDSNDKGQLSIRVDDLLSTPPSLSGDVRIASANDGLNIELFRQIDGDFRIVVGPEPVEGKTYECVFNNACVITRSWLPDAVPNTPLRCP